MELILDLLSWGFILSGSFFLIVSGVGLLRMPDVFTRQHAAGIADTAGADLILTGLLFQSGFSLVSAKILLILLFLFITSPVATHALSRAALQGGVKPIVHDREEG